MRRVEGTVWRIRYVKALVQAILFYLLTNNQCYAGDDPEHVGGPNPRYRAWRA